MNKAILNFDRKPLTKGKIMIISWKKLPVSGEKSDFRRYLSYCLHFSVIESTTRIKKIYEWFFPCSNFTRFPHNHLLKKKLPVSGLKSGFWRSKVWSSHLRVCYHTKCLNEKPIREPVRPLHIEVIEYKSCRELFLNIIAMQNRYTWAEKYS